MSEPPVPEFDDATLRRALREAPGRAPDSDLTSEQLRAAAAGELPPDEMQTVLDAANRDPALRLGLALAFELESDASAATTAPEPRRIRDTIAVALPIAACLALVWLVWPRPEPTISDGLGATTDPYRGTTAVEIETKQRDGTTLPIQEPTLRWQWVSSPGTPTPVEFRVHIVSADGEIAREFAVLDEMMFVLPTSLVEQARGHTLLWSVERIAADGTRRRSKIYEVRVR